MTRRKVAIVEDEQVVALDLQTGLEDLGYEVVGIADNGPDAIQMVRLSAPDVVLMDIALKGPVDGIDAAVEIRRRWRVPVIFLTAYANDELVQRARSAAPLGYLVKPLRKEELKATLVMALRQHELTSDLFAARSWLSSLLNTLGEGILSTDASGYVRLMNPEAERLTGWRLEEAEGRPVGEIHAVTTLAGDPVEETAIRQAVLTGAPVRKQRFRLRHRLGSETPVEESAWPIRMEGRLIGTVSVLVDITERLAMEEAQQRNHQRLEEQVSATSEALGETRAELRALAAHLMSSQEEERSRIARELHDDVGQRAASLEIHLQKAIESLPETARVSWQSLRTELSALSRVVREVSHQLHPSIIEDLGLEAALVSLARECREQGMDVSVSIRAVPPDIPNQVTTALYRIAQEGLRNIRRHAPGAPARLLVTSTTEVLLLVIEDAGPGFDLGSVRERGGLGLLGMQERARLAGGSLLIQSKPGEGTCLEVRIPNQPEGDRQ